MFFHMVIKTELNILLNLEYSNCTILLTLLLVLILILDILHQIDGVIFLISIYVNRIVFDALRLQTLALDFQCLLNGFISVYALKSVLL